MYTYIKKFTVFTLCSKTEDSIQILLRQAEKSSISLVEHFNITYDGKEPKKCLVLQRNDLKDSNTSSDLCRRCQIQPFFQK